MADIAAHLGDVDGRSARRTLAPVFPAPTLSFAAIEASGSRSLVAEWAVLANRSAGDNPFFHPDFVLPAIAHLGKGISIAVVTRLDGSLAALTPFAATHLGWFAPVARLWSHDYAPLGLPLIAGSAIGPVVTRLIEELAPRGSGASLVVPDLPLDGPIAVEFIAAARRQSRPVDVLGSHLRAVLDRPRGRSLDLRAALPARRRKEYGRQMRRLAELGTVSIDAATDNDNVVAAFEQFMALEAAGWKGKRGTALICNRASAAFAREAVANRSAAGAARIDSVSLNGNPIAMVVSFVVGATAFTWKMAYDETCARFSPGAQLMLDVAAKLFADLAITRIDSCASADHPMIDRLWAGRMAVGTLVIGPPGGGVLHGAGLAAAKTEIAARSLARRLRR